MAVAEKATSVEPKPGQAAPAMLVHCALAALYVLASLWLVFMGLPCLWRLMDVTGHSNEFLADSLLFLVTVPVVLALFVLGKRLEGPKPIAGLRAGAAYLCATVLISGLLLTSGQNLWAVVGIALIVASGIMLFQPWMQTWLVKCEENLWFHAVSFKPNQGLRVRRGTVIGVMVLVICGVFTLINHGSLRTGSAWMVTRPFSTVTAPATDAWIVQMPFSSATYVFLFHITLTVPFLFLVVAGWLSWRLVNWPAFADFLIATEAEMNKVSWTTRKRLYQDTVVVLTTVILMTLFLFVIDIVWIKVLTAPFIRVLEHDPQQAAQRNQSGAQW
jgi:preprotein translocase SecE subunit